VNVTAASGLRIGCVPYLNARPLVEGLTFPIKELVPAKLGEAFDAGEFDSALLSSIDVIKSPFSCAVDGVSISSLGDVHSVVLAYRGALRGIEKVTLDSSSHTSNALLKIVLEEFYCVFPKYVHSSDCESLDGARLIIGDPAISFRKQVAGSDVRFLDLGGAWHQFTGLPFVYAIWALRKENTNKKEIAELLRNAKILGLGQRSAIASKESDPEFALRYLTESIRYDLGADEKTAISLFGEFLLKYKITSNINEVFYY